MQRHLSKLKKNENKNNKKEKSNFILSEFEFIFY